MAHLFGDKAEEVDDHFGQADEILAAQYLVLCCNARSTIVQVADPQVLATQCDHRASTETETLGAEHGCLDNVETGLESTVRLQADLVTHVLGAQNLVRFG